MRINRFNGLPHPSGHTSLTFLKKNNSKGKNHATAPIEATAEHRDLAPPS
jgi:hypothetical protein